MKNLITFCLMFVMVCFTGLVFGDILPTEPTISGEIQQSMNFEGFNANLYARNQSAWLHEWTDDKTGQTYSHVHEKESSGSLWFELNQGFMNQNYLPADIDLRISRWNDEGSFNIESSFTLLFADADKVQNWIAPPSGSMGWNLFGIRYDAGSSINHEEEYNYDDEFIRTDNIHGSVNFSFVESEVQYARFSVDETSYWDNGAEHFGMRINTYFDIQYLGSQNNLENLNQMIPLSAIPEPATISVLALGGILLRVLRRRK
ncbi:MAG: PEP-CTERM sorting domain-containing protein [Nanoarchaeota archaeon]